MGGILGAIGGALGGMFGGGGDPIAAAQSQMNQSLQEQSQLLQIQQQYEQKKAALDMIANISASKHQADENIAKNLGNA